jgi:prepilin-type N-terminal cleavage/methylation domain-containing protein
MLRSTLHAPRSAGQFTPHSALRAPRSAGQFIPHSALRTPHSLRGFTLVELLVVISILAILAGMVIAGTGSFKEKRLKAKVSTELAQVDAMINQYKSKTGYYPPDNTNHPSVSGLFFELSGCTSGPSGFVTLDKTESVNSATLKNLTGNLLEGIMNCTRESSEDATHSAVKILVTAIKGKNYLVATNVVSTGYGLAMLGMFVEGPVVFNDADPASSKQINPWRYTSTNPTNNPNSFDLWIDVKSGNKILRFSNWSPVPQVVTGASY